MKKILRAFVPVAIPVLFLCGGRASAYLTSDNERLDHAIYAGHEPKLIIAGEIVRKNVASQSDLASYPAEVSFRFKVASVILGSQTYKGQTITLPANSFEWPAGLLDFKEGVRCALVLRTDWGEKNDELLLCSVVPLSKTKLPTAKDDEEAKRILATEILLELKQETAPNRQRNLILQVAPILQAEQSGALVPFLKSDDIWLRRAALAGLVFATGEAAYRTMAMDDIKGFIRATGSTQTITGPDGDFGASPYPLLFSHYFFFDLWSREDVAVAVPYLPFFRLVAHEKGVPEWQRWQNGVHPLCMVGTREDAGFLYAYGEEREGKEKREIISAPLNREEILIGISRILNLGLNNWVEADFLKHEKDQHQQVSEALVKEGIIPRGAGP